MYNDLSKLKLNLMLVRKASIRVAFFLFLVYLVVTFAPWHGWLSDELSSVSLFGSALLLFLCVTMAFLEDEVQKILNKSPFGGGLVGSGFSSMMQPMGGFDSFMQPYSEGMSEKDDLFAPIDGSGEFDVTDVDHTESLFDSVEEGIEPKDKGRDPEVVAFEKENEDYWKEKLQNIPERTVYDFKERATALRDLKEKRFDLLRNEFLAHVFGTPEGNELPEGQDPLTFNPQAYHYGAYFSHALLDMSRGEWLHYQNRLKTLFQDEYRIDFDDECNVSYRLK